MDLRIFWAKTDPFQSILTHAIVSGTIAQALLDDWLSTGDRTLLISGLGISEAELAPFIGYLVSLHDIGKLEYSFQVQDAEFQKLLSKDPMLCGNYQNSIRHEKTGADCLKTIWQEMGEEKRSARLLSKIVGAHHQGKTGSGNFLRGSAWYNLQKEMEREMRARFIGRLDHVLPSIDKTQQGRVAALLLGLLILSDWIASGEAFSDAEQWIDCMDAENQIRASAGAFLERSGLTPLKGNLPDSFCGVWPNITSDGRRPLQKEIERLMKERPEAQLVLIEAPMGEGKTEAGVYAAVQMARVWGKDGLYVALPTAATSNQMVGRIRALLKMHGMPAEVRLLHAMAWMEQAEERSNSPDERDAISAWLAPVKRGLLGQYAVGTVDQAMLAATNVKYGVLRLLGLSNKVLLIDEIHSYDAYMSQIIIRLLEWCKALEIPIVMLSATLPPEKKEKLFSPYSTHQASEDYPLITAIERSGTVTERRIMGTSHCLEVSVNFAEALNDAERIAELAVDAVAEGGCLCVLMNTVREAQMVYTAIKQRFDDDLLLFHAQFPAAQRSELENACIRRYGKDKSQRPKRSILVATQVVEQSLDVDFDRMITAVAPIDLVLQRVGRVFRHGDTPRPPGCNGASVTILIPAEGQGFGSSAYVYPDCLLRSTLRVLKDKPCIRIPERLAALVREGYDPSLAPEEEVKRWQDQQIREQVEAGASQEYLLSPPDKLYSALDELVFYEDDTESWQLSAKTRLGEPTVRIALLSREELEQLLPFLKIVNGKRIAAVRERKAAERVLRQSVSVPIRRLGPNLSVLSYISGANLLSGLKILPAEDGICRMENGKTVYFDPELGLLIKDGET